MNEIHVFSSIFKEWIDIGRKLSKTNKGQDPHVFKEIKRDFEDLAKKIEKEVLKGLEIDPKQGLGWFIRGIIEGMRGKNEKAREYLKKAYKYSPGLRDSAKSDKFLEKILKLGDSD